MAWLFDSFSIKSYYALSRHYRYQKFDLKDTTARSEPIMESQGNLTLEQQFKLTVVKEQVKDLSLEQAQEFVVEMMRQMMVKDNLVKQMLKEAWM